MHNTRASGPFLLIRTTVRMIVDYQLLLFIPSDTVERSDFRVDFWVLYIIHIMYSFYAD